MAHTIKNRRMKFWKTLTLKAYFDKGYGVTGYLKYLVALFGISTLDVVQTLGLAFIYGMICFVVGWLWYKYRLADTENEILNKYNPFVRQVRRKI